VTGCGVGVVGFTTGGLAAADVGLTILSLRFANHSSRKDGPLDPGLGTAPVGRGPACKGRPALGVGGKPEPAGGPKLGLPDGRLSNGLVGRGSGFVSSRLKISDSTAAFGRPYFAADNLL
jgi:hypothetical protein